MTHVTKPTWLSHVAVHIARCTVVAVPVSGLWFFVVGYYAFCDIIILKVKSEIF